MPESDVFDGMSDGILLSRDLDTLKTRRTANMPKKIASLSATDASKSKPKEKDYKLADGDGMYPLVTVSGGTLWRYGYRFNAMRKTMAPGQ